MMRFAPPGVPRTPSRRLIALLAATPVLPANVSARQESDHRDGRFPGSAIVAVDGTEYLIRVECRVRGRPEAGFTTEPNRITREQTGRSNMVSLHLRPWHDTGDVLISLDRYVAWIPSPASVAGLLSFDVAMSPGSILRDGTPVNVTYEMWQNGDRPTGRDGVRIVANCNARDPAAPAFRKVGGA